MLVQRISLSSDVYVDQTGLAMIVSACKKLAKGPQTVNDLWPGELLDFQT